MALPYYILDLFHFVVVKCNRSNLNTLAGHVIGGVVWMME